MGPLKRIVIAVPRADIVISTVSGTYKIMSSVIAYTGSDTELLVAGSQKDQTLSGGLFSLHVHLPFEKIDQADLIIVPAIQSDFERAIQENAALSDWLVSQYKQGAYLASLCSGAFLLGGAGILAKKRCTTHWIQATQFRHMFPEADHQKHNVITEDQRVFTNGGAFTFLNLVIHLIDRFYGKEAAQWAMGVYQVDGHRNSQHPFVLFNTQKDHTNAAILKTQDFIEKNYMKKLTNAEVAAHCNLGERTFVRQFKRSCGNTPNEYLQRVRIEKAKELLANSNESIAAIQYDVGYNDPKTFRTIFLRYTSLTPSAYRKRFSFLG